MASHHDLYLEELVNNLGEIGETPRELKYFIRDGIYRPEPYKNIIRFCDLILVYHPNEIHTQEYGVPVELKGSKRKRRSALEQLANGTRFITEELGIDSPHGKFVTYNKGMYEYEKIKPYQRR